MLIIFHFLHFRL